MTGKRIMLPQGDRLAINQPKMYVFIPEDDITLAEVVELLQTLRIAAPQVGYDQFSPELQRHFAQATPTPPLNPGRPS